jgi:hypothetical protein
MRPRIRFSAVPYAITADNALNLGGIGADGYLRSNTDDTFEAGHTLTIEGDLDVKGNLSVADTDIEFTGLTTNFNVTGDFSVNTSHLFINKSTGNIAIGGTDPGAAKLHVTGNIVATSHISTAGNLEVSGTTRFNSITYTWPSAQSAGYILQTNGAGTLSWVDPG